MDFEEEKDFESVVNNESVIDSNDSDDIFKNNVEKENIFNANNQVINLHEEYNKIKTDSTNFIKPDHTIKKENKSETKNIFNSNETNIKNNEENEIADKFSMKLNLLEQQANILKDTDDFSFEKRTFFQKYAVVLPIFAFVLTLSLGIYLFVLNTKADETNLIKIKENNKIGYIDNDGNKIINAKYVNGSEFYKGYAIVKNQNNLTAIIDNKGNFKSAFGNYFYIERFNDNYIVSKFTKEGLKLGLIDSSLRELTRFKYDTISYAKNNLFLFTRDDILGILNKDGKEIYTFAVDEVDDKDIQIEVSNVDSNNNNDKYAKIRVNNSSTIINLGTGEEVYKYTLNDIYVTDNNVFYIKGKENNKYLIFKDNKLVYETSNYKLVRLEDYNSNILVCLKSNLKYDYINLNTKKIINNNNYEYYYGSGLILQINHDFNKNVDKFYIRNDKSILYEGEKLNLEDKKIVNGMIKIKTDNMKYNFINKYGKRINDNEYDSATNFDKFGYSIVSKNDLYGVIDKNGKEVISIKYNNIKTIDEDLFEYMKQKYNKELFIAYTGEKAGIVTTKNDIIIKETYDSFKVISSKTPIIIGLIDNEENIINLDLEKEYNIKVVGDITVNENSIIINGNYYNYNGKLIYKRNNQEG